jgi:uncharacterized membrane protein YgcG
MGMRRAFVATICCVVAVAAPRPAACDTFVRDDLNLLRADTIAQIQTRNADLIARTGACVDVITAAAAGDNPDSYALTSALALGNHCNLGASILLLPASVDIRFEDASGGMQGNSSAITQALGNGIAAGDVNAAVMTAVNAIADGIIAHPPSPRPVMNEIVPPAVSVGDGVVGVAAANWQTTEGRIALIAVGLLLLFLIARLFGLGRTH